MLNTYLKKNRRRSYKFVNFTYMGSGQIMDMDTYIGNS